MLGQGKSHGFYNYVVEGHLVLIAHLGELHAQLRRSGCVILRREKEGRNWAIRLGEPARDRLSDLSERDVLEVAFRREPIRGCRPSGTARGFGVLDVALDDAPARSTALDSAELNSFLGGQPAR
jgi:hypothetical protein